MRTLCALLVACVVSMALAADDTKPPTSALLVARPGIPDPNFKGSTVLVMNHLGSGPAGIILNRPTPARVSHLFPDLENLSRFEDRLYFGGPVGAHFVSFVFRADQQPEYATEVVDGVYFSANPELLRQLLRREKPMEGLRIFVGYAGWAPDQLEAEIARGDWTLKPAEASAIFDRKSERPWPEDTSAGGQRASGPAHDGLSRVL